MEGNLLYDLEMILNKSIRRIGTGPVKAGEKVRRALDSSKNIKTIGALEFWLRSKSHHTLSLVHRQAGSWKTFEVDQNLMEK